MARKGTAYFLPKQRGRGLPSLFTGMASALANEKMMADEKEYKKALLELKRDELTALKEYRNAMIEQAQSQFNFTKEQAEEMTRRWEEQMDATRKRELMQNAQWWMSYRQAGKQFDATQQLSKDLQNMITERQLKVQKSGAELAEEAKEKEFKRERPERWARIGSLLATTKKTLSDIGTAAERLELEKDRVGIEQQRADVSADLAHMQKEAFDFSKQRFFYEQQGEIAKVEKNYEMQMALQQLKNFATQAEGRKLLDPQVEKFYQAKMRSLDYAMDIILSPGMTDDVLRNFTKVYNQDRVYVDQYSEALGVQNIKMPKATYIPKTWRADEVELEYPEQESSVIQPPAKINSGDSVSVFQLLASEMNNGNIEVPFDLDFRKALSEKYKLSMEQVLEIEETLSILDSQRETQGPKTPTLWDKYKQTIEEGRKKALNE